MPQAVGRKPAHLGDDVLLRHLCCRPLLCRQTQGRLHVSCSCLTHDQLTKDTQDTKRPICVRTTKHQSSKRCFFLKERVKVRHQKCLKSKRFWKTSPTRQAQNICEIDNWLSQCTSCSQLVIHPDQRFNFFSDYSQTVSCPQCGIQVRLIMIISREGGSFCKENVSLAVSTTVSSCITANNWFFAGLPFFKAAREDIPEQGWAGGVVASVGGLRATRRHDEGAPGPLMGPRHCPLLLLVSYYTHAWLINWLIPPRDWWVNQLAAFLASQFPVASAIASSPHGLGPP